MLRGALGTRRTERRLVDDVNVRAIPLLRGQFQIADVTAYAIGGDAPKDLIFFDGFRHAYIAKGPGRKKCATRPRVGPLECVTEYMICRVGSLLRLRVAAGRLVRLPTPSAAGHDVRFMSRIFLDREREVLTHGLELVARCLGTETKVIEEEVRGPAERQFYTVDFVDEVLQMTAGQDAATRRNLRDAFARMMAFDALIGSNDRHPWNWGVVESLLDPDLAPRFTPIYDTARGLFWNHPDEVLAEKGDGFIGRYAEASTPLIGLENAPNPSHFDVIAYMTTGPAAARFARSVRSVVWSFRPDAVTAMLHNEFRRVLSRDRLQRVDRLLQYRHARLIKLC